MPTWEDLKWALSRIKELEGKKFDRAQYGRDVISDDWRRAYAQEHGGALPGEVSGESELEAIANRLWSLDFLKTYGRGPTQEEWVAHWERYGKGLDPTWETYLQKARELVSQPEKKSTTKTVSRSGSGSAPARSLSGSGERSVEGGPSIPTPPSVSRRSQQTQDYRPEYLRAADELITRQAFSDMRPQTQMPKHLRNYVAGLPASSGGVPVPPKSTRVPQRLTAVERAEEAFQGVPSEDEDKQTRDYSIIGSLAAIPWEVVKRSARSAYRRAIEDIEATREGKWVKFPEPTGMMQVVEDLETGKVKIEPSPTGELFLGLLGIVDEPVSSLLAAGTDVVRTNVLNPITQKLIEDYDEEELDQLALRNARYTAFRRGVEEGTPEFQQIYEEARAALEPQERLTQEEVARRLHPSQGGMIYPSLLNPAKRQAFERLLEEGYSPEEAEAQVANIGTEVLFELLGGSLIWDPAKSIARRLFTASGGLRRIAPPPSAVEEVAAESEDAVSRLLRVLDEEAQKAPEMPPPPTPEEFVETPPPAPRVPEAPQAPRAPESPQVAPRAPETPQAPQRSRAPEPAQPAVGDVHQAFQQEEELLRQIVDDVYADEVERVTETVRATVREGRAEDAAQVVEEAAKRVEEDVKAVGGVEDEAKQVAETFKKRVVEEVVSKGDEVDLEAAENLLRRIFAEPQEVLPEGAVRRAEEVAQKTEGAVESPVVEGLARQAEESVADETLVETISAPTPPKTQTVQTVEEARRLARESVEPPATRAPRPVDANVLRRNLRVQVGRAVRNSDVFNPGEVANQIVQTVEGVFADELARGAVDADVAREIYDFTARMLRENAGVEASVDDLITAAVRDASHPVWDVIGPVQERVARIRRALQAGADDVGERIAVLQNDLRQAARDVYMSSAGRLRLKAKMDADGLPTRVWVEDIVTGEKITPVKETFKPRTFLERIAARGYPIASDGRLGEFVRTAMSKSRSGDLPADMARELAQAIEKTENAPRVFERVARLDTPLNETDADNLRKALWHYVNRFGTTSAASRAPDLALFENLAAHAEDADLSQLLERMARDPEFAREIFTGRRLHPNFYKYIAGTPSERAEKIQSILNRAYSALRREGDDELKRLYNEVVEKLEKDPNLKIEAKKFELEFPTTEAASRVEEVSESAAEGSEEAMRLLHKIFGDEVLDEVGDALPTEVPAAKKSSVPGKKKSKFQFETPMGKAVFSPDGEPLNPFSKPRREIKTSSIYWVFEYLPDWAKNLGVRPSRFFPAENIHLPKWVGEALKQIRVPLDYAVGAGRNQFTAATETKIGDVLEEFREALPQPGSFVRIDYDTALIRDVDVDEIAGLDVETGRAYGVVANYRIHSVSDRGGEARQIIEAALKKAEESGQAQRVTFRDYRAIELTYIVPRADGTPDVRVINYGHYSVDVEASVKPTGAVERLSEKILAQSFNTRRGAVEVLSDLRKETYEAALKKAMERFGDDEYFSEFLENAKKGEARINGMLKEVAERLSESGIPLNDTFKKALEVEEVADPVVEMAGTAAEKVVAAADESVSAKVRHAELPEVSLSKSALSFLDNKFKSLNTLVSEFGSNSLRSLLEGKGTGFSLDPSFAEDVYYAVLDRLLDGGKSITASYKKTLEAFKQFLENGYAIAYRVRQGVATPLEEEALKLRQYLVHNPSHDAIGGVAQFIEEHANGYTQGSAYIEEMANVLERLNKARKAYLGDAAEDFLAEIYVTPSLRPTSPLQDPAIQTFNVYRVEIKKGSILVRTTTEEGVLYYFLDTVSKLPEDARLETVRRYVDILKADFGDVPLTRKFVALQEALEKDARLDLARLASAIEEVAGRAPERSARAFAATAEKMMEEGTTFEKSLMEVVRDIFKGRQVGQTTPETILTLPVKTFNLVRQAPRRAMDVYFKTELLRGAIPIIGAGIVAATPTGEALIYWDENGRVQGFLPDQYRAMTKRVIDELGIGEGHFEKSALLEVATDVFDTIDRTSNLSVAGAWYAITHNLGRKNWVGDMLAREDLTAHQKWALLTALQIGFSGEDAVRAAYEELVKLDPEEVTHEKTQQILEKHKNGVAELFGTIMFDPTDLINIGNAWKAGTLVFGKSPKRAMDLMEWREWRAAKRFWEEGNPRLWDILTKKLGNVLYTPYVRAARAARDFDLLISSRIFGLPVTTENWRKVVDFAFKIEDEGVVVPQTVKEILEGRIIDKARAGVIAYVERSIRYMDPEEVTNEVVDRLVREGVSKAARDIARTAFDASSATKGWGVLSPLIRFSKWQKNVLNMLLLNAFNFGFHVRNYLTDTTLSITTIGKRMFAPEARGYISLARTGAMRRFWMEEVGHLPTVVMEGFGVLGDERAIRHFGDTPILKHVPGVNKIPSVESLSALRIYTASFIHWMSPLYKNALTTVVDVGEKLGVDSRHARELYANLAGVWRIDRAANVIEEWASKYGYDEEIVAALTKTTHKALTRSTAAALAAADETRGLVIHHYWKKTRVDELVEIFFPFHFWFTRSQMRWVEWNVNNPTLLSNYLRIEEAIKTTLNKDADDPEYMTQSMVPLPTSANPWLERMLEIGARKVGKDVDASMVTRMMDALVLKTVPQVGEFDIDETTVYANVLEASYPLRNVFALFGGDTFEAEVPEDAIDSAIEKLITAGGRYPAAYSPLIPLIAAAGQRIFGTDATALRYMMEPSVPFAQDRVIRGLSTYEPIRKALEDLGVEVPAEGLSLEPVWRKLVDAGGNIWTQDAPDYYYKMAARLIAIDVERGVIDAPTALRLITEQNPSDPRYARYLRLATHYYAGRGAISGITGILLRYSTDNDIRAKASRLYELAAVRDENGNQVIGPDGKPVFDFDKPEVQEYIKEHPEVGVFRTSYGEFEERLARAGMEFYYNYASAYTRRQFRMYYDAELQEAMQKLNSGEALTEDERLRVAEYMEGRYPSALVQKLREGRATDKEKALVARKFFEFYDSFTSPDEEARRMEVEALVDEMTAERYPKFSEIVSRYYELLDAGEREKAREFAEANKLDEMFDFRAYLFELYGNFPTTSWEQALNPPSQDQIEFAIALGVPEEVATTLTSYQLSARIMRAKLTAANRVRALHGDEITLEYLDTLWDYRKQYGDAALTEDERNILEDYLDALFIGPNIGEPGRNQIEYARRIGIDVREARQMTRSQLEQAIERRKEEALQEALANAGGEINEEELRQLIEDASKYGISVVPEAYRPIVRTYWDALYIGPAEKTKELVKTAAELGASPEFLRTASGDEIQAFIDNAIEQRQAQSRARRAKFALAAESAGVSVDEMSRILDYAEAMRKKFGSSYKDYMPRDVREVLEAFYTAYYGPSPYDMARQLAAQQLGVSVEYIEALERTREAGARLPNEEWQLLKRFWSLRKQYLSELGTEQGLQLLEEYGLSD